MFSPDECYENSHLRGAQIKNIVLLKRTTLRILKHLEENAKRAAEEIVYILLSILMKIWLMAEDKNIRVCQVLHGIVGGGSEQVIPLVSVVVPVYNAARTLKKCVDSLTSQIFDDVEILLINNGSTDNSLDVCKEIAGKDSRIKVIDTSEKGVSAARNRGIELATGEFVTFVDADDWIDPDVCKLFADLNAKHNYDLFCYSAQYQKKGKITTTHLFGKDIELLSQNQKEELQIKVFAPQAPIFSYKMNTRFAGSACGKFYKRKILLENNLRFATETIISEDVLFNTLALDFFCKIGYTRKYFYHYVQQNDSAQNRYRPNSDKYFCFVIGKIQHWLQNTGKDQRFVDAANCLFIHYIFGILKEDVFHKDNPQHNQYKYNLMKILDCLKKYIIFNDLNKKYFSMPERILVDMLNRRCFFVVKLMMGAYKLLNGKL